MASRRELSIILVNWNSAEYVRECVRSICEHETQINYEIIVVDNASLDGCDKVLREFGPNVVYIQSDQNLGFAKANNLAVQISSGATLLFLNPDTEIIADAIYTLYKALHSMPGAGALGAKLVNRDGSLQTSCVQSFPTILNQILDSEFLRRLSARSNLWGMDALFADAKSALEVEAISGACIMVKREVFDKVGGFSTDFFMYAEDVDLCHKIKRVGYRNYYVPGAVVIHFGGGSSRVAVSNFSVVMTRESIWRLFQKNRGRVYAAGYRIAMSFSALLRLVLLILLFPVKLACGRRLLWVASFRKWQAILSWSANREKWIEKYR